jgi:hypothetical protein
VSIWIPIGFATAFVALFSVRGVLLGKREARRLEALFAHVASCQCPACGAVYGADVKSGIELSFDYEDALPDSLANNRRVSTWRIPCQRCRVVAVLAEDYPGICEFLKARA